MICESCQAQQRAGNPNITETFCSSCGRNCTAAHRWNAFDGRLVRPRFGRRIGGVCAGIAQAYGFDLTLVRLVTVLLVVAGFGSTVLLYIAAWIVMPNAALAYPPVNYAGPAPGSPAAA